MSKDSEESAGFGIEKIKEAVLELSPSVSFRDWFNEFEANAWNDQFELDVGEGRLDALADEAMEDVRLGRSTEL